MQDDSQSELVSELAKEFLERCREGRRPALSEYTEKHPELAEQIREVFPMMLLMEDVAPAPKHRLPKLPELQQKSLGDFHIERLIGRGGMGVVYEATQVSLGRRVALKVCPLSQVSARNQERFRRESRAAAMLHHTNIVSVFAVGEEDDMLYYAMQYIHGATLDDVIRELHVLWRSVPTATTRLTDVSIPNSLPSNEIASVVARSLAFPNKIFNSDAESDSQATAKSATEEIATDAATMPDQAFPESTETKVSLPGQALSDSSGGAAAKYWESVAHIGVQIADALAYAHGKGTIHRDIKPSNLILDQSGTVWVMDFGLAKSQEEDDLTREGELVGTLRYMAPEQCHGHSAPASDIYSLGLTLYELLALRPAYNELHRSELLRAISERDPISPRKINHHVPRDLETITMKCIARDPSRRYANAQELVNDLKRFLAGEPILARPVSLSDRVGKWVRRRPLVAGLLTSLALLFVASFALVSWKWRDAEGARSLAQENAKQAVRSAAEATQAREDADLQANLAQQRLMETQAALYRSAISRAEATSQSDPKTARQLLMELVPQTGEIDRRGWEWGYLNNLVNQEQAVLQAGAYEAEWIRALAFSHDERLLATGAARTSFSLPRNRSPKGRATIWSIETGEILHELPVEHSPISLAFSRNDKRLAVCEAVALSLHAKSWDSTTKIWDLETETVVAELDTWPHKLGRNSSGIRQTSNLEFLEGDELIVGTIWADSPQPSATAIWNTADGSVRWLLKNSELLEYHPDTNSLLVAKNEQSERVVFQLDLSNFKEVETRFRVPSSDDRPMAQFELGCNIPGAAGKLFLTDYATLQKTLLWGDDRYKVHVDRRDRPVAASAPDGSSFAIGATDGTVRIWDSQTKSAKQILRGHQIDVQSLVFSDSGNMLASGDWNGEVRIWRPGSQLHHINCRPRNSKPSQCLTENLAFQFNSSCLISYGEIVDDGAYGKMGVLSSWDVESGLLLQDKQTPLAHVAMSRRQLCFDQTGIRFARILKNEFLEVCDTQSGEVLFAHKLPNAIYAEVSLSSNGKVVAVCTDYSGGPKEKTTNELSITAWEVDTGQQLFSKPGYCRKLALDATGQKLAFNLTNPAQESSRLHIVDLESGQETICDGSRWGTARERRVSALEFSLDSREIAVCTQDGELSIFDSSTGQARTRKKGLATGVEDLAWHPSGKRLAGVNRETVILWDEEGNEILNLPSTPRQRDMPFDPAITFSPDGTKLAATSWDSSVNLWSSRRPYAADFKDTKSTVRGTRVEYAAHTIQNIVDHAPNNPWFLAARGQLADQRRLASNALSDYRHAKEILSEGDDCLFLHGNAYVQAPSLPLHEMKDGHTLEAWVKHWNYIQPSFTYGVIAAQYPATPKEFFARQKHYQSRNLDFWGWYWLRPTNAYESVCEQWSHVAVVFSPEGQQYFLNGKHLGNNPPLKFAEDMSDFFIGDTATHNPNTKGRGLIRSLRVSKGKLYQAQQPGSDGGRESASTESFEPPEELAASEDTLLLFDFTIDDGMHGDNPRRVEDRSGHGRHGRLHKAWWLAK